MTKVKITCGGYGRAVPGKRTIKTAYMGDVIEVDDAEAERLESIGAARIIRDGPAGAVATTPSASGDGGDGNDTGEDKAPAEGQENPVTGNAAKGEPPADAGTEDDVVELQDCIDVVDGHLTVESLMEMSKDDLVSLATDMGVHVTAKMNKRAIAEAISKVEVSPGDEMSAEELRSLAQEESTV